MKCSQSLTVASLMSTRKGRFRRISAGLTVSACVLATLAGVATSVGATLKSPSSKSPLQQGLNFYKGKTITVINPTNVGGGYYEVASAIGTAMGIYLHATVNVESIGAGESVAGQDALAAANPNGLTIGMIDSTVDISDQLTGAPGPNFNAERLAFLGGQANNYAGFTCSTSSHMSSFADVIHSSSPVTELAVPTGTAYTELVLLNSIFGIKAKLITGYPETSNLIQGFERGDGACVGQGSVSFGSWIAAGKARMVMISTKPEKGLAYDGQAAGVPTLAQLVKEFPPKTKSAKQALAAYESLTTSLIGHQFNAPTKVSADKVDALRAAVEWAFKNPAVDTKLLNEGQTTGYVNGQVAKASYIQGISVLKPVTAILAAAA
jgi:hypothetical protein